MNATELIAALDIPGAPSDTVRAKLLVALDRYGQEVGNGELMAAARAAMPTAHPFVPPGEWREFYDEGFTSFADEDQGVYLDDMRRYGTEYWQGMQDTERQDRLAKPFLGKQDGEKDAQALNEA